MTSLQRDDVALISIRRPENQVTQLLELILTRIPQQKHRLKIVSNKGEGELRSIILVLEFLVAHTRYSVPVKGF